MMTTTRKAIAKSFFRAGRYALWPVMLCIFSLSFQACASDSDSFFGHTYHNFTAYFNAYYNAKVEFDKGLKAQQLDPTLQISSAQLDIFPPVNDKSQGQEYFSNVITKTSDILKSHPRSDLADDALLLMGKSYYYKAEFQSAERKFQEIITNYPESELLDEASFWYGRTLYQEYNAVGAKEVLQSVISSPKAHEEVKAMCRFSLAELTIREGNYEESIRIIEEGLPAKIDDNLKSRAAFALARLYSIRGEHAKAAKAYSMVSDLNPTYDLRYASLIGYAVSLRENGHPKESADILNEMLGDNKNLERFGDIRYELATTYAREDKLDKAVDLYIEIIRRHPKSEYSAKSYYQLGILRRDIMRDFKGARAFFDSSRTEYARGQTTTLAAEAALTSQRLLNLYETVGALDSTIRLGIVKQSSSQTSADQKSQQVKPGEPNPGTQQPEPARKRTRKDYRKSAFLARGGKDAFRESAISLTPAQVKPSFEAAHDTVTFMRYRKELIVKQAAIGNYFHVTYPVMDSALSWYKLTLTNIKAVQPIPYDSLEEQVRQVNEVVLFSIADLYRSAGEIDKMKLAYQKLLEDFPKSRYINVARANLGLPQLSQREQMPDRVMYEEAYAYLDRKNPQKALRTLKEMIWTYPKSTMLPKAMLSVGFIYEHHLNQPDSALSAYQQLQSKFSNSPEAKSVSDKVKAVLEQRTSLSAPQKTESEKAAVPSEFTQKVDLKKSGYSICIGSFPDKASAQKLADDYAKKGLTITLWEVAVKGKLYNRALVGSFSNQEGAQAAIKKNQSVLPQEAFSVKVK